MRKHAGLAALVSTVTIVVACSSNKPAASVSLSIGPDGGAPTSPEAGPPPAPATDAGPPATDAGPVATGPVFFTDAGAPPSTPNAAGAGLLDGAIDIAITTASPKLAPKMTREAQIGRETLAEGGHFGMIVTLQPNTCYTVIGYSPPGAVEKLDLRLYGPLPLNVEAGKSGSGDKAMPVMGRGSPICPIALLPTAYKIDATATKGAGRIGVHVFSRPR